jgi:hypothetical protein
MCVFVSLCRLLKNERPTQDLMIEAGEVCQAWVLDGWSLPASASREATAAATKDNGPALQLPRACSEAGIPT